MISITHAGAHSQPEHPMTHTMALRQPGSALLSREEAARALGVSPLTLSRYVARRRIRAYRIARRLRFSERHLREFLDRHEVQARP